MTWLQEKLPCSKCKSNGGDLDDNNIRVHDDGHGYCFACHTRYTAEQLLMPLSQRNTVGVNIKLNQPKSREISGSFKDIETRGISKEVCQLLGIMTSSENSKEFIYLYDNGVKLRKENKDFPWVEGNAHECTMFGLQQAIDYTKPIIICEGEFDTASCYEVGYQSCSLNNSGDVVYNITRDLEELKKYSEIWLGLDNDEPGQTATKKALELLPLSKIKIIDWGDCKDANDWLKVGLLQERLADSVKDYTPKGIVLSNNLNIQDLKDYNVESIEIPLPKLYDSFGGFDKGCTYFLYAGAGTGKTTLMTWLGLYYRVEKNLKIFAAYYEENENVTPLRFIGMHYKVPVGKLRRDKTLLTLDQWEESKDLFNTGNMAFLTKDADRTSNALLQYIEYLVTVQGFDLILVDHISYLIGRTGVSKNGERRDIDEFAYKLQELTMKLNCITLVVSHISDPNGTKGWDEGEIPGLYSGRGSRVLAQIADGIIGVSRNMKHEYKQSIMDVYNLKNRWGGKLGKMDSLLYYDDKGTYDIM